MSSFTCNGKPTGYYRDVLSKAASGMAELVRSGKLSGARALELAATVSAEHASLVQIELQKDTKV